MLSILNGLDEDDEDLLVEANRIRDNADEVSPLFQDNLRCSFGRHIARRFSSDQSRSNANQSAQPGERIIEIESDEDDFNLATSSSTVINERTNLINNDYRFQRFRPIRIQEHDLTSSDQHSQPRMRQNYQVLKSKKRVTFPICFFVGLYISFLVLSSFIFTMFEQKMANTDSLFELQKRLMFSLNEEQYDLIQRLVEQSVLVQKSGLDVIGALHENRLMLNEQMIESTGVHRSTPKHGDLDTTKNAKNESDYTTSDRPISSAMLSTAARPHITITNQIRNRKTYNWDFQQALFYVVSIATTIG